MGWEDDGTAKILSDVIGLIRGCGASNSQCDRSSNYFRQETQKGAGPLLTAAFSRATFCTLAMAESAYVAGLAIQNPKVLDSPRHSVLVRVTHWINAISFIALLVSGVAILLAHPRLYWGETGGVGGPSLIDLPLPFVLETNIRGPGRYLHFLSAWVCVLIGLLYIVSGAITRHFRREFLPPKSQLAWHSLAHTISNHLYFRRPPEEEALSYNVLQRLAYLTVVFILFPLMIWTGLAMSPGLTSVFPWLRSVFGGQQSARTIHFFVAVSLVLFLLVHIVMVIRAGFRARMCAMITGQSSALRTTK